MLQENTMNKRISSLRTLAAAALAAGCVGAAHAEGFYAGASVGTPHWNDTVAGVDGDSNGVAGKLYGGYAFTPNFALEAGAARLGHESDLNGRVRANGAFLDAVGTLPLNPDWSLLGRVGVARGRFTGPAGDHDSDTNLHLGAGVQYRITPAMALRAEYEQYRFHDVFGADANVGQVTAGLKVDF
jgi:OOP family OmpA-OmpF porin